jgi:hypothetical protein
MHTLRGARLIVISAVALVLANTASGFATNSHAGKSTHRDGSSTALAAVSKLQVKDLAPKTGYSRKQFGPAWKDVDQNGCDTRDDILRRDLTSLTSRSGPDGCIITSGALDDPYTATLIQYKRGGGASVDIDHVAALGDDWRTGAATWTADKRLRLANDPLNLLAVSASANRQKGDKDASDWLPPNSRFVCTYVAYQVAVKLKYGLWVTPAERATLQSVLGACPKQPLPTGGLPLPASASGSSGSLVPSAPPQIQVDAPDVPIRIRGFIGEDPGFVGDLRLHAVGNVGPFRTLFSDLKRSGGTEIISRAHLSIVGAASLANDEYEDLQVKVDSITVPGTYSGALKLLPSNQPLQRASQVPIEIIALARPTPTALAPDDQVRGGLAHCSFSCGIAGWLVPGSAGRKRQTVRLTLGLHQTARVTAIQAFGIGDHNGHELSNADLGLTATGAHVSHGVLEIPISINPDRLPADHYSGTVRVTLANLDTPVSVPIDFNVRSAPYWAIIALGLGIALGRISNYLQKGGKDKLAGYQKARLLERRVQREIDDETLRNQLVLLIATAREALDDDDLQRATQLLGEVDNAFQSSAATSSSSSSSGSRRGRDSAAAKLARSVSPVEGDLALGTHVAGVLVWIGLLLVGYQTLYLNQGTSFGSNGIFDYVGLILWGLTADVATRGLANLAGGPATASA